MNEDILDAAKPRSVLDLLISGAATINLDQPEMRLITISLEEAIKLDKKSLKRDFKASFKRDQHLLKLVKQNGG